MSTPPDLRLQNDVAARLAAAPFFAALAIAKVREGHTENDIAQALGPMRADLSKAGAKAGALVLVMQPSAQGEDPNAPGPRDNFELVVRVLYLPKVAQPAGVPEYEEISQRIKELCHLAQLGTTPLLYLGSDPYNDGQGTVGADVRFSFKPAPPYAPRVATPRISGNAGAVAIECNTPGATIYCTENGEYPDQSAPLLYWNPFAVAPGTLVRAVAYKDELDASGLTEKQF